MSEPIRTTSNRSDPSFDHVSPAVPGSEISEPYEVEERPIAPTFSTHWDIEGLPYTADFFELQVYWDDPLFKEVRKQMEEVEDYVWRKIQELNLSDTKDSYKEVIDNVLDLIGGNYRNEKPQSVFNRIHMAISAINRMESAKIEPVLSASMLRPEEYENIYG